MTTTLRLATFNVENLDDRPGLAPSLAARIGVLRPQLLRLDADVLCLQEVNAQQPAAHAPRRLSALARLIEDTPYRAFHQVVSSGRGGGLADVHNLVILSRFPVLTHRQYWHDLVPAPTWRPLTATPAAAPPTEPGAEPPAEAGAEAVEWERPILHAVLGLDGKIAGGRCLHVLNLHLRSPLAAFIEGQKIDASTWRSVSGWAEGLFLAEIKRAGQALEARMVVDRLFDAASEALIAVAGDFNAAERDAPVRALRGEEEDTGNGRLAGRVLVPAENSVPESQRFSVRHHGARVMMDHVLMSKALLAWYRHGEIHNEALEDELVAFATVSRAPGSYHAPVVAEFALPGAG